MTEAEVTFSYNALISAEAHRQLGREMDGNLRTIMAGIQPDIDAEKKRIRKANRRNRGSCE